ncbi:DinB family protein [Phycisphaerales bacterium AB-hyl4]|uniref:DinB family protein n=1 Tax=Natronomicrosphaera hydrolytica TaxID=3242702 RepID=A0ABV4TZU1_9BACT
MPNVIEDLKRSVFRLGDVDPLYGGPTLAEVVADIDADAALFRLNKHGHSIWEIVLHAAFWRCEVAHALSHGKIDRLARAPENWPALPQRPNEDAWRADRKLLDESERALQVALDGFAVSDWSAAPEAGGDWSLGQLAIGLIAHDAYHIGQVALLKKAAQTATRSH